MRIALHRRDGSVRAHTLVDESDYAWLSARPWCLVGRYAGRANGVYMHREILGLRDQAVEVDHVNRDPLDNRRENLRVLNRSGNAQNVSKRSGLTSRYRNVSWDAHVRKWRARVCVGGEYAHLGLFDDENEAARVASAYRAAKMPFAT